MRTIYFTVWLFVGTAITCSAQFCVKRFVGGKWITKGDCRLQKAIAVTTPEIKNSLKAEPNIIAVDPVMPSVSRLGLLVPDKKISHPTHEICRNASLQRAGSSNATGGVYEYIVPGVGTKKLYCDLETDGANWIVLQRRINGNITFDRNWTDYTNGFGELTGDFWLGLETIHQITNMGNHELRIDIIDVNGTYYIAKYRSFVVGNSTDKYRLHLARYSGNSTDALLNPKKAVKSINNQKFSTRESDNDDSIYDRNCAVKDGGGWWFQRCIRTNLNKHFTSMEWKVQYPQKEKLLHLVSTEMKFREAS